MSKSVKRILSVAAVVAIPFAAPAIAGMMASSAFFAPMAAKLGATGMSALAGAGLGAGKAAVFGEDIGRGALLGAASGGVAGYLKGPPGVEGAAGAGRAGLETGAYTQAGAEASGAGYLMNVGTAAPSAAPIPQGMTAATAGQTGSAGLLAASAPAAAAQPSPSVWEAIKSAPAEIAAKYQDPKAMADLMLRAAGQMAGSALAGSGLTSEEQKLLEAQRKDLEEARRNNAEVFRARLDEAQKLIGESAYFDPEYFGLQGARQAQMAGGQAARAGLRGMTGDRRATTKRQYELGTARNTGTAYDSGYQRAVSGRLQTRAAGLAAFPGAYPGTDYSALMQAYGNADNRKRQTEQDIGKFTRDVINPNREQEVYDDELPQGG